MPKINKLFVIRFNTEPSEETINSISTIIDEDVASEYQRYLGTRRVEDTECTEIKAHIHWNVDNFFRIDDFIEKLHNVSDSVVAVVSIDLEASAGFYSQKHSKNSDMEHVKGILNNFISTVTRNAHNSFRDILQSK